MNFNQPKDFLMVSMSFLISKLLILAVPADGGKSPVRIELQFAKEIISKIMISKKNLQLFFKNYLT